MTNFKFTCPVSMRVTEEQYERDLRKPLLEMGYKELNLFSLGSYPYLCTNYGDSHAEYSNRTDGAKSDYNRYYIDHYNPELFLALAAMTDAEYGIKGEYWETNSPFFRKQLANKALNISGEYISFVDDIGLIGGIHITRLHKASKETLLKMFNKKVDKMEENPQVDKIKMAYEKANDEQRRVLREVFPEIDNNAFVKRFDHDKLLDISEELFDNRFAMQIGVNCDLNEYQKKCFWFNGDFFEKPIVETDMYGNYILKLHKK